MMVIYRQENITLPRAIVSTKLITVIKMENADSKHADIPRLMILIYKYITDTIAIMEREGIDPTKQISLAVTKQHELATWDLIFDLSSLLILNYFPKEPDYRYLRLYNIVPKWKLHEDQRTAFYAKYLELENELEEWQNYIYKEKTMEVLSGIYTKLGNVAVMFAELATMREVERMKRV